MNDHEILHYLYDNPAEATTQHPLVKNNRYGFRHDLAYTQNLLTPLQIKTAHDLWVGQNDPMDHSTPIAGPTVADTAQTSRWDQVVIANESLGTSLTKRDVFRYYATPMVKKQLFTQLKDNPALMRQAMDTKDSWLKRSPVLRKDISDAADPEDLQYYIERRHVEFHPTFGTTTKKLVIDVDPGESVSPDDTKKVVHYLEKLLGNQSYINDVEIQFSGHRGYYVWGVMSSSMDINTAREKLKTLLKPIADMNGVKVTTTARKSKNTVRLDLSPVKHLGSVKAEGSLDYRTGLISKKVLSSQLGVFNPQTDASINTRDLKPAYSYKDEQIV